MRLAALLALALLGAVPADAQPRDPRNPTCPPHPGWSDAGEMRFTVRERAGAPPVLIAEGAIDAGMVMRLEAALAGFSGEEVWLRSIGGDAIAGNRAGMAIRAHGLRTRIPAGWACRGACGFMFMGGTQRHIEPDGLFIVHMFTLDGAGDAGERARTAAVTATEDYDFLLRMGVSPRLLSDVMYRQSAAGTPGDPSTHRCLTPAEIAEYRIADISAAR
jgi:hypothetical protein